MLLEIILPLVVALIMFSLGLNLRPADFWRVATEPKAFAIGAFNQIIVVPIAAFCLATLFGLSADLAFGMMILSACPGGIMSNAASKAAGGNVPLSISLTGIISLVSIITLPIVVSFSASHFLGADTAQVKIARLGIQVFVLTAVPVGLGLLLTHFAPAFVEKIAPSISKVAFWLMILLILAAMAANWTVFTENFWLLAPCLIALTGILLTVGVLSAAVAGLSPRDATTIAIESGTQNGSLGIAVGLLVAGVSEGLPPTTLPSVVYSVSAWIFVAPFMIWRRRAVLSI